MAKRFLECSLEQPYLLPPSLQDWLPAGHLARFIADVAEQLDLSALYAAYDRKDGRGLAAYHPLMLSRLLLYGYAVGVRSSRAIEKATYDELAFRYLSADQHPDHDTIANFRQQHLRALAELFVQALRLCRQAGLVKLGTLAIDGTKVKAQASERRSMRLQQIRQEEQRLHALTEQLLEQAAQTDADEDAQWGKGQPAEALPLELADAQKRLQRLRQAKQELEEEAKQQLAEAEAACPARQRGRPPRGTPTKSPGSRSERETSKQVLNRARRAVAGQTRHYNFSDPDSRMMRDGGTGHVVQAYNAQIAVDGQAQIIVAAHVTQQALDKQQLAPMLEGAQRLLGGLPENVVADNGYWSYSQLTHPIMDGTNLLVPPEGHRSKTTSRLRADNVMAQTMRGKLSTVAGRMLYTSRQHIVEPVFAHIKEQRRFRRFSFRGLAKVTAEWSFVCLTHNLLKLYRSGLAITA
jgi:transposase